jgi:hypothetical protein
MGIRSQPVCNGMWFYTRYFAAAQVFRATHGIENSMMPLPQWIHSRKEVGSGCLSCAHRLEMSLRANLRCTIGTPKIAFPSHDSAVRYPQN